MYITNHTLLLLLPSLLLVPCPGKYDAAKEGLLKLEDISGLLQLNVEQQRWDDAFLLLAANSQLKDQVYIPYAKWLLSQDRCGCVALLRQ
jgi:hypothetical protein